MSFVKINHLCKGEWYGVKNSAAWVTPQLKQTCSNSLNYLTPKWHLLSRWGDAQAVTSLGVTASTWYKPSCKVGAGESQRSLQTFCTYTLITSSAMDTHLCKLRIKGLSLSFACFPFQTYKFPSEVKKKEFRAP